MHANNKWFTPAENRVVTAITVAVALLLAAPALLLVLVPFSG